MVRAFGRRAGGGGGGGGSSIGYMTETNTVSDGEVFRLDLEPTERLRVRRIAIVRRGTGSASNATFDIVDETDARVIASTDDTDAPRYGSPRESVNGADIQGRVSNSGSTRDLGINLDAEIIES